MKLTHVLFADAAVVAAGFAVAKESASGRDARIDMKLAQRDAVGR